MFSLSRSLESDEFCRVIPPITGYESPVAARCRPRGTGRSAQPYYGAATDGDFEGFVGASAAMRAVYDQIARIARSRAPVFVTGESGTGKELCAEAVHARSGRGAGAFIAINCSAIPRDLMESEIFGHVRGAFTGAVEDRPGAAELADGGTLFLDEIGELDLALQAKLLRFIQTGAVRRVGDVRVRPVDVRFVCATNRDPFQAVESGQFREDLFYRLHVLPIRMPPLRARRDDIVPLATRFLTEFAAEEGRGFTAFSPAAEAALRAHAWPGNVRELQNVIRRAVVLHDGDGLSAAMLPIDPQRSEFADNGVAPSPSDPDVAPYRHQERDIIETALAAFDGNILRAATALEISPSTIYRKRQAWAAEGLL